MALPKIVIEFIKRAQTAIIRSMRSVVVLILADNTKEGTSYTYNNLDEVKTGDWDTKNLGYLKLVFKAKPKKVLVERVAAEETSYDDALTRLSLKKWNYLAVPGIESVDGGVEKIKDWIIKKRGAGKTYKAVLPNCAANHEGIINFTTTGIKSDGTEYTTAEYCARIAGFLAVVPLNQSCTYMVVDDITEIEESLDPDTDVDNGKLIIVRDDDLEAFVIGSGVNSLTTISNDKTEDYKDIKVVEGMDLMTDDIRISFKQNYVGKNNSFDNKIDFTNALELYGQSLQKSGVLNREYNQSFNLDAEATAEWLREHSVDVSEMDENEILRQDTKKEVFVIADVKFQMAMENLTLRVML